ncbi:MAG: hypothetical protein LBC17_04485 [Lactobacillaceae bacterium]|jgi:NADH dehydrogenase/NADH:ubiquinone oxidoreductase subunit G|nr:hypothetical protein [Lactobacillaceae bacterium]
MGLGKVLKRVIIGKDDRFIDDTSKNIDPNKNTPDAKDSIDDSANLDHLFEENNQKIRSQIANLLGTPISADTIDYNSETVTSEVADNVKKITKLKPPIKSDDVILENTNNAIKSEPIIPIESNDDKYTSEQVIEDANPVFPLSDSQNSKNLIKQYVADVTKTDNYFVLLKKINDENPELNFLEEVEELTTNKIKAAVQNIAIKASVLKNDDEQEHYINEEIDKLREFSSMFTIDQRRTLARSKRDILKQLNIK